MVSKPNVGSTFTLYLPIDFAPAVEPATPAGTPARYVNSGADVGLALVASMEVEDDRDMIKLGDRVILIIEDDVTFAGILLDIACEHGFKGVVSVTGGATLSLTKKFRPDAITLDLGLTDIDGWTLLYLLKHDLQTRHIPVQVLSFASGSAPRAPLRFLHKPYREHELAAAVRSALDEAG